MIVRVVKLMEPLNSFLTFYNSAAGRKVFAGSKTKLKVIDEREWAIIQGAIFNV